MIESIYPCLWFDKKAHEAAEYYCNIFPDSRILNKTPMVCIVEITGKKLMFLDAGPEFTFNEAVSFVINCETQNEVDYYWTTLSKEGKEGKCGWLTDKYGLSWQVVPSILGKLMSDPIKAPKAMYAFMQMKKFEIDKLISATE